MSTTINAKRQRSPSPSRCSAQKAKRSCLAKSATDENVPLQELINHTTTSPSLTTTVIGRTEERAVIEKFLTTHITQRTSGCMYISGSPGTGKTALMCDVLSKSLPDNISVINVNCMTIQEPKAIYTLLLTEIWGAPRTAVKAQGALSALRTCLTSSTSDTKSEKQNLIPRIIILDEVDYLISRDQEVLYTLFELPFLPNSQIILISIANALDLTERFLPRLRAKNFEPQLLNVRPYTVTQITDILKEKIVLADSSNNQSSLLFAPNALDFIAKKVASSSGDLRKALDVCKLASGIAKKASANSITIPHIVAAFNTGSTPVTALLKVRQLNFTSKLVLLAIAVLVERTGGIKTNVNYGSVYDMYCEITEFKHVGIPPITQSEFNDVCSRLESLGLFECVQRTPSTSTGLSTGMKTRRGATASVLGQRGRKCTLMTSIDDIKKGVLSSSNRVTITTSSDDTLIVVQDEILRHILDHFLV